MQNKIVLTGNLADEFAPKVPFGGTSVTDALLCLDANFPKFRAYLIKAAEEGIEFSVSTKKGEYISDPFLNLIDGDVFITAVPAGSKSGGAKIAAAAAIFALLVFTGGAAAAAAKAATVASKGFLFNIVGSAAGGYTTGLTWAGQALLGVGLNLAFTGIQQILAPDPAVDEKDEGYLFSGSEQSVTEGMPVPVLYGELAVPGYPVSFETVAARNYYNINTSVSHYGDYSSEWKDDAAVVESDPLDARTASFARRGGPEERPLSRSQNVLFTDIVSEGPICGLVHGGHSILLNGDPAQTKEQSAQRKCHSTPATIEGVNEDPSWRIVVPARFQYNTLTVNWQYDQAGSRPLIDTPELLPDGNPERRLARLQIWNNNSSNVGTVNPPGTVELRISDDTAGSSEAATGDDLSTLFENSGKIEISANGRTVTINMSDFSDKTDPYKSTNLPNAAELATFADNLPGNNRWPGTLKLSVPATATNEGKITFPENPNIDLKLGKTDVRIEDAFVFDISSVSFSGTSQLYTLTLSSPITEGAKIAINEVAYPLSRGKTKLATAVVRFKTGKELLYAHVRTITNNSQIQLKAISRNSRNEEILRSTSNALEISVSIGVEIIRKESETTYVARRAQYLPSGSRRYDIDSPRETSAGGDPTGSGIGLGGKYGNFLYSFKNGNPLQDPYGKGLAGQGIGKLAIGPGPGFSPVAVTRFKDSSLDSTPVRVFGITDNNGFGVRTDLVDSIAYLKIVFSYGSLFNTNTENGKTLEATVTFKLYINDELEKTFQHIGHAKGTAIFEERIPIDATKFEDKNIQIKIERVSFDDQANDRGKTTGPSKGYSTTSSVTINSLGTVFNETLTYPLTAMAKVSLNSKDFSSVPSRAYHCKGLLIKVPSNYKTRDETGGVAEYSGLWDGTLREERVYCNNPAWVLYDILTSERYGIGSWVNENDLNIYSFYKIARYCDELVPANNKGGLEPRFTCNVYLRTAAEAYKVIKDLSTVFTGILYWIAGQASPIADERSYPVYIFNDSNIIDGEVSYESTGRRTRVNQVVVNWNNPENTYKIEPLIVEDEDHIVQTGQINSENASAFGATSRGQALRYGRWKLWTARNQTEIITFKTAINAVFLSPGDVIIVPKYANTTVNGELISGKRTLFNGRIIEVDEANNRVRIDKYDELEDAGYDITSFTGSIVMTKGVAKSVETEAFTDESGNEISPGDIVPGITREIDTINYRDGDENLRFLQWIPDTYTETFSNGTSDGWFTVSGTNKDLTVGSSWVTERIGNSNLTNKEYKILAINEESENEFSITAVEYFREKFDSIEKDFVLTVEDPVYKVPGPNEKVPPPKNVYVVVNNLNSGQINDDATLYFDPPETNDGDAYPYTAHYEIEHKIPGIVNPIIINKEARTVEGLDLPAGAHTIGMRTVNTFGQRSVLITTSFFIDNPALQSVPRRMGVALGATVTSSPTITNTGSFETQTQNWAISPIGNPSLIRIYNEKLSQDCSGLVSKDYSTLDDDDASFESGYIFYKESDEADPFKLVLYKNDATLQVPYLYHSPTGAEDQDGEIAFTEISNSISIPANSVVVTGTNFTNDYQVGDTIKLGGNKVAKIAYIVSDTDMRIDRSFGENVNDATPARLNFRFDRNNDCVFALVRNNQGSFEWFPIGLSINAFLVDFNNIIFTADPAIIQFKNNNLVTDYTNLTLTVQAIGYTSPEFRITGAGFDAVTQSSETSFSAATSGKNYVKTLSKISSWTDSNNNGVFDTEMRFIAEIREKGGTDVTARLAITIPVINVTDGQDGQDGQDGNDGTSGRTGARQTIGYVYYTIQTDTAPSTPTGEYNFSTGTVTGLTTNWSVNPPTIAVGTQGSSWVSRYIVTETGYNSATDSYDSQSITFSLPSKGFTFNGIVTFTSGDESFKINGVAVGNSVIDGGFIKTGTLAVNTIKSGVWTSDGSSRSQPGVTQFGLGSTSLEFNTSQGNHCITGYFEATRTQQQANDNKAHCWALAATSDDVGRGATTAATFGVKARSGVVAGFYKGRPSSTTSWGLSIGAPNKAITCSNGSTEIFYFDNSGNLTVTRDVTAASDVIVTSDVAVKDNIKPITSALEKIEQLTGYTFRKFGEYEQAGVIAQEVEKVLPEAVTEKDGLKGVSYGSLIALLVEAIKELSSKNN